MTDYGEDWDRYAARNLGLWHGRALVVSPSAEIIHATSYTLSSEKVNPSISNPSILQVCSVLESSSLLPTKLDNCNLLTRYDLNSFHCFADSTFSADHSLLHMPGLLPTSCDVAHTAIEFCIPLSATDRARCFLMYNAERHLTEIVLLEEARAAMFDTREPVALTTLIGDWHGLSETFRHEPLYDSGRGFAKGGKSIKSPTYRAKKKYSKQDLPEQLKNPSSSDDGLLRTKSTVCLGWDPANGTLRRSTLLHDMQQNELGRSVIYGSVNEKAVMFDMAQFENGTPHESLLVTLNNGCFIMAPIKRARGVPVFAEFGCLVTPSFRRRVVRMYGRTDVISETLAAESLS